MDVSTIQTDKTAIGHDDEKLVAQRLQQNDPAFVQLLASLGIALQAVPQAEIPAGGNVNSTDAASASVDQNVDAIFPQFGKSEVSAAVPGVSQEVGETNGESQDVASLMKALLDERRTEMDAVSAVDEKASHTEKGQSAVTAQANTGETSPLASASTLDPQSLAVISKFNAAKNEQSEAKIAGSKLENSHSQDRLHPDRAPLILGGPSLDTPPSAPPSSSDSDHASPKDALMSEHALVWRAALEGGDIDSTGKNKSTESSEKRIGNQGSVSVDTGMNKSLLAHAVPPVSPPSEPVAVRSVSATAPIMNVALDHESPLAPSVRFEVHPDEMGRVRVHLSVIDHTVYTKVLTDRVETHDFLVKNSERFEAGLAAHGLDVGRFQVDVHTQGREQHDRAAWARGEGHGRDNRSPHQVEVDRSPRERALNDWDMRMVNVFA